jgi:carbon storage regulator CsrA
MLVLSRKRTESVMIGGFDGVHGPCKVTVLAVCRTKVKLGFEVDADVPVHRTEVWERIQAGGEPQVLLGGPAAATEEMGRWEDDGGPADATPRQTVYSETP